MVTYDLISTVLQSVRRSGASKGGKFDVQGAEGGELVTADGLPSFTEITRQGDGWTAQTATLFAPIAAYPSTTARLELHNNHASKVMVVKDLFAAQVLSTAATQTYAIFAMVSTSKAAPTNTALVVASVSGQNAYTTTASSPLITAVDTTVVANGWRPYGSVQAWGTAAATPGNAWSAAVDGALIVPPRRSLCIAVAGSLATASTFQCGATFYWTSLTVDGI